MFLVIAFLSRLGKINDLIIKMKEKGFSSGTLVDSVGLRRVIPKAMDVPLIASLSSIFNEENEMGKILFCVVENEKLAIELIDLIEDVFEDLHKPHTGLVVSVKLDHVRGFDKRTE